MIPEDTLPVEVAVALIHHLLRYRGPLTAGELARHVGGSVSPAGVDAALDAGGAFVFKPLEGTTRWQIRERAAAGAPAEIVPRTPKTAGRFCRGGVHYAVLPDGAVTLLLRYLERAPIGLPYNELLAQLHRFGWRDIDRDQLLLHLAHFADFELVEGRWHKAPEEVEAPPQESEMAKLGLLVPNRDVAIVAIGSALKSAPHPLELGDLLVALKARASRYDWTEALVRGILGSGGAGFVRIAADDKERWSVYKPTPLPTQTASPPKLFSGDPTFDRLWRIRSDRIERHAEDVLTDLTTVTIYAVSGERLLTIQLAKVRDDRPWWVAWLWCESPGVAAHLQRAQWHLWRSDKPPDWDLAGRLLTPPIGDAELPSVATWRAETPVHAKWAILRLVHDELGVTNPNRVQVYQVVCSPEEARGRLDQFFRRQPRHLAYDSAGRLQRQTLTWCEMCGHALSDPRSASIGIGPECLQRIRDPLMRQLRRSPGLPLSYWVGAVPLKRWQEQVSHPLAPSVSPSVRQLGCEPARNRLPVPLSDLTADLRQRVGEADGERRRRG